MTTIDIFLIGVGLSMDAAAVSMTNGMAYKEISKTTMLIMALLFGIFQALMPLFGYFIGGIFSEFICKYSGTIILFILGLIGANMIKEGLSHSDDSEEIKTKLTYTVLFVQAIATSIDAFAVGVGFAAKGCENIILAVSIIGVTTFIISLVALFIGRKFGNLLGSKAEVFGGIILVLIGIKAILPI